MATSGDHEHRPGWTETGDGCEIVKIAGHNGSALTQVSPMWLTGGAQDGGMASPFLNLYGKQLGGGSEAEPRMGEQVKVLLHKNVTQAYGD